MRASAPAQLRRPRSQSFQAAGYPSIHRSIIVRQQRTVEGRLNDSREILVLPAFDGVSIQTAKCFPPPPAFDLGPGPSARESTGAMAFHEKAGRSQVDFSLASLNKVFCSPAEWPLSPCFHPH